MHVTQRAITDRRDRRPRAAGSKFSSISGNYRGRLTGGAELSNGTRFAPDQSCSSE